MNKAKPVFCMKSKLLQAAGRPQASDVAAESKLIGFSLHRPKENKPGLALKETTAARDRKQYRALVESLSFQNRFYHRDFCPGHTLWQYLATNPLYSKDVKGRTARRSRRRKRTRSSQTSGRPSSSSRASGQRQHELKLLLPDTVVQYPSGCMIWLYTDRNGYVRRVESFDKETFLERFGNCNQVSRSKL